MRDATTMRLLMMNSLARLLTRQSAMPWATLAAMLPVIVGRISMSWLSTYCFDTSRMPRAWMRRWSRMRSALGVCR